MVYTEKDCAKFGPFGENVRYECYAPLKLPEAKFLDVYMEIHKDRYVSIKNMARSQDVSEAFVRKAIAFARKHYGLVHARKGNRWYWCRRSIEQREYGKGNKAAGAAGGRMRKMV